MTGRFLSRPLGTMLCIGSLRSCERCFTASFNQQVCTTDHSKGARDALESKTDQAPALMGLEVSCMEKNINQIIIQTMNIIMTATKGKKEHGKFWNHRTDDPTKNLGHLPVCRC